MPGVTASKGVKIIINTFRSDWIAREPIKAEMIFGSVPEALEARKLSKKSYVNSL